MDNSKIVPYSQHYRCSFTLFKAGRDGLVFSWLFDEYLCRYRQGKPTQFTFSARQIAEDVRINKNSVNSILPTLVELGLIELDGSMCSVNAAYFFAVINLYCFAPKETRAQIREAFLTHDLELLRTLGLQGNINIAQAIGEISTGVLFQDTCTIPVQVYDNSTPVPKQYSCTKTVHLDRFLEAIQAKSVPKQYTLDAQMADSYEKLADLVQVYQNSTAEDVKSQIHETLIQLGAAVFMGQVYYSGTPGVLKSYTNPEKCTEIVHINKDINKKENEPGERSETGYIEGEEKGFEGLEVIELLDPVSEKERYSQHKKEKPYLNPYRNKPYFSEKAMEKVTADIDVCTKSPVKLFIYNLWGGLYDWYQAEIEDKLPVDEYGEPLKEESSDLDMLRTIISETMLARIVKQAWYETEGQIECKNFQLENDSIPVEIDELPDIHLEYLIDWKSAVNENGERGFVISLEGFRNIEADDVVEVKQAKSKDEKKAMNRMNRQMIAIIMSTDKSQLTPIEIAIKDFTSKFIQLDDSFHFEGFLNGNGEKMGCNELPGYLIKPWSVDLVKVGIKQQDFYNTFNLPGEYKDGSSLRPMATTFSYQKVHRWNEMNGYQSQITPEMLEKAAVEHD